MRPLLACLLMLALCGCDSVQHHRARQMRSAFGNLTPPQQEAVLAGTVARGYTPDMVYIALGKPWQKRGRDGYGVWRYKGWLDDSGHFRSTWELRLSADREMKELRVVFRDGLVDHLDVRPLQWPPEPL